MLQTLLKARSKAGRQVDVLVICGHGSRETPGLQLGAPGVAGQLVWQDVDLASCRGDLQTAQYLLANPQLPAAKNYTQSFLQGRIRDDTARIRLLQQTEDVMAQDGVIILLNCSAAATKEGREYVLNFGRAFLGKRGGRIVASRVDVVTNTLYDQLWQWVANRLAARPQQMLLQGDFIAFPVFSFTGRWNLPRASRRAGQVYINYAQLVEAGPTVTGGVIVDDGTTWWNETIKSDNSSVRTVGAGVKQLQFRGEKFSGTLRLDLRKPLLLFATIQNDERITTGPFAGGTATRSYGESTLEFMQDLPLGLSQVPETGRRGGIGDKTELALSVIQNSALGQDRLYA